MMESKNKQSTHKSKFLILLSKNQVSKVSKVSEDLQKKLGDAWSPAFWETSCKNFYNHLDVEVWKYGWQKPLSLYWYSHLKK